MHVNFDACKITSSTVWKIAICVLRAAASFMPLGFERVFERVFASRQESFMPLRSKWRTAGLTHRRLEVMVTLPQGIVTERRRGLKRNGKPLRCCVIVLIVQTRKFPSLEQYLSVMVSYT